MPPGSTVKRVRVRLRATDKESLLRVFGAYLGPDSVFLTSCAPIPLGTPVLLEIRYATREVALRGRGHVAWVRDPAVSMPGGIAIAVAWDEESRAIVDWVQATLAPGERHPSLSVPPVAADLLLDAPTPGTGTPAIVLGDVTPPSPSGTPPASAFAEPEPFERQPRPISAPRLAAEYLQLEGGAELVALDTDEIIPEVPGPAEVREAERLEWERQTGEVTPLARIDLVRRPSGAVPADRILDEDSAERRAEAVPAKGSGRRLGPKSDLVLGIDLGTTYSCAAIVQDGLARVIPSRRGTTTIPSVVLIHPGGKTIVGEPALRKQPLFPSNTIVGVKRLIGRPYHSPVVQRARARCAYEIVEGDEGEAAVRIGEHHVSLEEISALILKEIRESASLTLHQRINRAVITCPAYYNERQREAVRTAGELAGLHVERVLSEPTAAALNYRLGRGRTRSRMLVYDLGGGTFDASLIDVEGDVFAVLATGGETFLGGIDFDACIVQLLVSHLRAQHRVDPAGDPSAMAYLYQLAEQAKRDLSEQPAAKVRMQHFAVVGSPPLSLDVEVKRSAVEELFEPLVSRTLGVVERVCHRAGLAMSGVDEVLLVGGQSRAPIVRRLLERVTGRPPRRDIHPDEAVALGAAQYAANMRTFDGLVLVDSLAISIGVGLPGGRFQRVIPQDTSLPAARTLRVETARDGQRELELFVFQGEDDEVANNELIGVALLRVPPMPRGALAAVVSFELDSEAMLSVRATDERTRAPLEVELITRGKEEQLVQRLASLEPARPGSEAGRSPGDDPDDSGVIAWLKRTITGTKRKNV